MALLIEKNTTILGNIDLTELYVRFGIEYDIDGKEAAIHPRTYPARASYDDSIESNQILVDGIPLDLRFSYDRGVDGSDLVTSLHNKFKGYLITDQTEVVNVYDPSTGDQIFIQEPVLDPSTGLQDTDPSTGDPVWYDGDPSTAIEIIVPRFTEDSSISFIDID